MSTTLLGKSNASSNQMQSHWVGEVWLPHLTDVEPEAQSYIVEWGAGVGEAVLEPRSA